MVFWFLFVGGVVRVEKELHYGERRMNEMEIYSRRSFSLPRSPTKIPNAVLQRCCSSRGSRLVGREIIFDEDSQSIFVQTGVGPLREWS